MPIPPSPSSPKYRHYKPKDLAVVRIDGRDHYLGRYNSPESHERYHRLLAERAAGSVVGSVVTSTPPQPDKPCLTISELVLAYWRHVQASYRAPDGTPGGEQENIKVALRPLRKLYGLTPAADFGPIALKSVRQAMIDDGLARSTINQRISKVVRLFRWGIENELVPLRRTMPSRRSWGCAAAGARHLSPRASGP